MRVSVAFMIFAFLAQGCSLSLTNCFGLVPTGHQLSETADALRSGPVVLPRELDRPVLDHYLLAPGDGLLLVPANLDSPTRLPVDQTVLPDGTIDLGKYGSLYVAGKTTTDLEREVNELVNAKTPDAGFIDVRLVRRESKVYYVFGEVSNPGSFPYNGRETVLDALVAAGWLTDQASKNKIIIARPTPPDGCRVVLAVCIEDIVQVGDTTTNYRLLPGDRVYVGTTSWKEGVPFFHSPKAPCKSCQHSCPLPTP